MQGSAPEEAHQQHVGIMYNSMSCPGHDSKMLLLLFPWLQGLECLSIALSRKGLDSQAVCICAQVPVLVTKELQAVIIHKERCRAAFSLVCGYSGQQGPNGWLDDKVKTLQVDGHLNCHPGQLALPPCTYTYASVGPQSSLFAL